MLNCTDRHDIYNGIARDFPVTARLSNIYRSGVIKPESFNQSIHLYSKLHNIKTLIVTISSNVAS